MSQQTIPETIPRRCMNKKTFTVTSTWDEYAQVTLQVDLDILTPALATEINQFWSDADWRLGKESGDVVRTVVRMFGHKAIVYMMGIGGAEVSNLAGDDFWTRSVLSEDDEGWPECKDLGILIIEASVGMCGYDEMELEEVNQ
ncbi:DUF2528 family protein [Delftia tsuruhatensis]|uniref:DUF2528 family protein n=2 Tax=Comamonadaceae TaxID=80864 RepID=UPI000352C08E|nr:MULTISPECIES: DUF2528 family protein [Delftia]EPD41311.1 hypothetical protein HMPREF9701_01865 [Delftia acidovorans CCUG 274B]TDF26072.1 DUF2528 family protein [Delftia tsuruhatensis]